MTQPPDAAPATPHSVPKATIREFFAAIPATYDWINTLMTFGLDGYWRKRAARLATRHGGRRWLDICAGTGQMSRTLARQAAPATTLIALDFCSPMLDLLDEKAGNCPIARCLGDVGALPFPDATFDLVTVAFATRNLHTTRDVLVERFREVRRVLRPGGRFLNLETSQPASAPIRALFHAFIGATVALIGSVVSGSAFPYRYLASSIRTFYPAPELADLLRTAGFGEVQILPMTFGAVAAHLAWKRDPVPFREGQESSPER